MITPRRRFGHQPLEKETVDFFVVDHENRPRSRVALEFVYNAHGVGELVGVPLIFDEREGSGNISN